MVVIAIVAILAAVAVPSYQGYIIQTKVNNAQTVLDDIGRVLILSYEQNGAWPQSFYYNGVQIIDSNNIGAQNENLNIGNLYSVSYYVGPGGDSGPTVSLIGNVSGLDGLAGYVAPSGSYAGANSLIRVVLGVENDTYRIACGNWYTNYNSEVPLEYQSAKCQCSDLADIYTLGNSFDTCP